MKYKATRKEIRESGYPVYCIGYCDAYYLLEFQNPFAYSTRAEGWACDYYQIDDVIISTGYAPIGKKVDYELCRTYNEQARKISDNWDMTYEQRRDNIEILLHEFVEKLTT